MGQPSGAAPEGESATAQAGYAAVIGDVVGSRETGEDLFERLDGALARAGERVPAVQPLQVTNGDEFQGVYRALGPALNATLLVRLLLHDVADVRFGVGWGAFTRWSAERTPYEQDGPAWWAAREALEAVERYESAAGIPRGWRTEVRLDGARSDSSAVAGGAGAPPIAVDDALQALLVCRDHILARLDARDVSLVRALLEGATATMAAEEVGISQQAASRRLRSNGGYALLRTWRLLEESA